MKRNRWHALFGLGLALAMAAGCKVSSDTATGGGAGGAGGGAWSDNEGGKSWAFGSGGAFGSTTSGAGGGGAGPSPGTGGGMPSDPLSCAYADSSEVHLTAPRFQAMVSPPLARALTHAGKLPNPGVMNPDEFLNYYRVRYPSADDGAIGLHLGARPGDLATEMVIQVAVQAPVKLARPSVALAVVVDTSLSMAGGAFARARASVEALAQAMAPGDAFFVVTSKRGAAPPIVITSPADVDAAVARARSVELDAGEDLAGAIADAYAATASEGRAGRVVLISDGAAPATSLDLGEIASQAAKVPLIGVAVSEPTAYRPDFWAPVTFNGKGAALLVDTDPDPMDPGTDAPSVLRDRFDELVSVAASHVEVILAPQSSHRVRVKALDPTGEAPSTAGLVAADLMAGRTLVIRVTLETCATIADVGGDVIDVTVRYTTPDGAEVSYALGGTVAELLAADQPQIAKADAVLAYAAATTNLRPAYYEEAAKRVGAALIANGGADADLEEIQALIGVDLKLFGP